MKQFMKNEFVAFLGRCVLHPKESALRLQPGLKEKTPSENQVLASLSG